MSEDYKLIQQMNRKDVADYLRTLADSLDVGGRDEFACLDDFHKIKVKIKNDYGQLTLKASIRSTRPCEPPRYNENGEQVEVKPGYSDLKKRMRSSFRVLVNMIHDGKTPPREAVDDFLADSALMVTYPGYGDEYYDEYIRVCDQFRDAYESGDMDRMHAAVDALVHEKSRCHARYD